MCFGVHSLDFVLLILVTWLMGFICDIPSLASYIIVSLLYCCLGCASENLVPIVLHLGVCFALLGSFESLLITLCLVHGQVLHCLLDACISTKPIISTLMICLPIMSHGHRFNFYMDGSLQKLLHSPSSAP